MQVVAVQSKTHEHDLDAEFFLEDRANGNAAAARPYLERACHLDPGSASAHLNLAAVYAELGRFPEARREALEALRLDPAEARAASLLKALPK